MSKTMTKIKRTKFKHNKKRNTAFLYEALIQELTKAVLEKNTVNQKKIMGVMKKHFSPPSQLSYELELYRSLYETKGVDSKDAERLVAEVCRQHDKKIVHKKLFKEQSELIKKINQAISSTLYTNFVPNYKDFATIAQLFSEKTPVKERVLLEKKIVQQISEQVDDGTGMEPIDNLTYRTFVEKFNKQYDGVLHEEQKAILLRHIFSFSDNGISLKSYLNEEIGRLKEIIAKSLSLDEVRTDTLMTKNTQKVIGILDSFKERQIDSSYLSEILKIQQLAREVRE